MTRPTASTVSHCPVGFPEVFMLWLMVLETNVCLAGNGMFEDRYVKEFHAQGTSVSGQ